MYLTKNEQVLSTARECLTQLKALGYDTPVKVDYRVSNRLTRALGNCLEQRSLGTVVRLVITISADVPQHALKDVVMHELIHAVVGGRVHHGYQFQALARLVNSKYGYSVGTYASENEMEAVSVVRASRGTHSIVHCTKCGREQAVSTKSKVVRNIALYRCKCGGSLEVK